MRFLKILAGLVAVVFIVFIGYIGIYRSWRYSTLWDFRRRYSQWGGGCEGGSLASRRRAMSFRQWRHRSKPVVVTF